MGRSADIPDFFSTAELGQSAQTGGRASAEDFGAQIGEEMQRLGGQISKGAATVAEFAEMHKHVEASHIGLGQRRQTTRYCSVRLPNCPDVKFTLQK